MTNRACIRHSSFVILLPAREHLAPLDVRGDRLDIRDLFLGAREEIVSQNNKIGQLARLKRTELLFTA